MLHPKLLPLFLLAALTLFSGCATFLDVKVSSVAYGSRFKTIYVQKNPAVKMDGLHPEVVRQLEAKNFKVVSFDGDRPIDARHVLTYTANWNWDLAMFLRYFEATLYEGTAVIGTIRYDISDGTSRMDKFGPTASKIKPLFDELLKGVTPIDDDRGPTDRAEVSLHDVTKPAELTAIARHGVLPRNVSVQVFVQGYLNGKARLRTFGEGGKDETVFLGPGVVKHYSYIPEIWGPRLQARFEPGTATEGELKIVIACGREYAGIDPNQL